MTIAGLGSMTEKKALLYKEYNITPESVKEDIQAMKDWMQKQPHLPKIEKTSKIIQ